MRTLVLNSVSIGRIRSGPLASTDAEGNNGAFRFGQLVVIASDGREPEGQGWEHVSVSRADRTPSWEDMETVKRLFWCDNETVIQFHPRLSEYVNVNPNVLHMWRRVGVNHELPPRDLIA